MHTLVIKWTHNQTHTSLTLILTSNSDMQKCKYSIIAHFGAPAGHLWEIKHTGLTAFDMSVLCCRVFSIVSLYLDNIKCDVCVCCHLNASQVCVAMPVMTSQQWLSERNISLGSLSPLWENLFGFMWQFLCAYQRVYGYISQQQTNTTEQQCYVADLLYFCTKNNKTLCVLEQETFAMEIS